MSKEHENDFEHYYNATVRLTKENSELKERITSIKADRLTYCAVSNHIHNCPNHPIQDYKAEIERLKAQIVVLNEVMR